MKKLIILLAALLITPSLTIAESTSIYPGPDNDNLLIITTDDDGNTRMSNAHKVYDGGYLEFDDQGNSRVINDFRDDEDNDWRLICRALPSFVRIGLINDLIFFVIIADLPLFFLTFP